MTLEVYAINAPNFQQTGNEKNEIPQEYQPLPWICIQQSFCYLSEVFLKLESFLNQNNLHFQGRVVFQINGTFVNPVDKVFSAVKGLSIQAQTIVTQGELHTEEGTLCLEAKKIDSEGIIKASQGPVQIFTQFDMQKLGLIEAAQGITLISEEGAISLLNSVLISPDKPIIIQTNRIIKSPQPSLQIFSTRVQSGLLVVSSDNIKIQGLWQQSGHHLEVNAIQVVDISDSTFAAGATLSGREAVLLENCDSSGFERPLLIKSPGIVALRNFHVCQAESATLEGHDILIQSSSFETKKTVKIQACNKADLQNMTGLVHEEKVFLDALDLECTDVQMISKGTQKIKAETANLFKTQLLTKEGSLKLKTRFSSFKKSLLSAEQKSVKIHSEEDLTFKKTTAFAKERLSLKTKQIHSIYLTAIAQSIQSDTSKDGNFIDGLFIAERDVSIKSKNAYLDLSKTEIYAGQLFVEAMQQILMPHVTLQITGTAQVSSISGWIEAQHTKITGSETSNEEINFTAAQSSIYLNHLQARSSQKFHLQGKLVQTENGSIDAQNGVYFNGTRILGKSTQLTSDSGSIALDGSKSIWLDDVQKNALRGQIKETSEDWILERHNENKGKEILRQASDITLDQTKDSAKKIQNEATHAQLLSQYSAEAEEQIVLTAFDTLLGQSRLKAPQIGLRAAQLSLQDNKIHFGALHVQSHNLQVQKNELRGIQSSFQAEEGSATFAENQLKIADNQIRTDQTIAFHHNQSEGSLSLVSEKDQSVTNNELTSEELHLESTKGNVALQENTIVAQAEELRALLGNVTLHNNDSEVSTLEIKAQGITVRQEQAHAEGDITFKSDALQINRTNLTSEEGGIILKQTQKTEVAATALGADREVVLEAPQADLQDTALNSSGDVVISVDTIRILQTKIASGNIVENAKEALHLHVTMQAKESIKQKIDKLTLLESSSKAQEISLDSNHIEGSKADFQAKALSIKSDTNHLPHSKFQADQVHIEGNHINLRESKFAGSIQINHPQGIELLDTIKNFDSQVIHNKRKIPSNFEGIEFLRQRGVLTTSDDLFIDDGKGHIDHQRIRNKLNGTNPAEQEILLRHFNNTQDAFGIRNDHGVHWTYLRPISNGTYQEQTTMGDDNCSFNGFAIGLCELILARGVLLTSAQLELFRSNLGLDNPTIECLELWIQSHNLEQIQIGLQGLLRHIAVDYIEEHEAEIYQETYQEQLYDAYCNPDADDTFKTHKHIARKFRERHLSQEELSEWWQTEGKTLYFANMRQNAWGGEVEIDALARYFEISIFWQKQNGTRSVGGKVIRGFNQEQIKRFLDLGIGEKVGQHFQLSQFSSPEELQEKMRPAATTLVEQVEQILEQKAQTALELPQNVPEERGVLTEQNTLLVNGDRETAHIDGAQQVNLKNASLKRGSFEVHTSTLEGAHLKVNGKSFKAETKRLSLFQADVKTETLIKITAKEEANFTGSRLTSSKISAQGKYLFGQDVTAKAEGEVEFLAGSLADLQRSEVQAASCTLKGENLELQNSNFKAATTIEGDANLNSATIVGSLEANSRAFDATNAHISGDFVKAKGDHLWLPGAKVSTKGPIELVSREETSIQKANLKSTQGITSESKSFLGAKSHLKTEGNIQIITDDKADLQKADANAGVLAIHGDYLAVQRSNFKAQSIFEEGKLWISAEKSTQAAKTVLIQRSDLGIDGEKASLQAEEQIVQKALVWINRREALNTAPVNIFITTVLDNRTGKVIGAIGAEATCIFNEGAEFELTDESAISASIIFSSPASKISGKGDIQIQSRKGHEEFSKINLDGTYQVEAPTIGIKTALSAENVYLQATQGSIVIDRNASVSVADSAQLDSTSLENYGFVHAINDLKIHQIIYRDPNDVEADRLLQLTSNSRITIKRPMFTKGSFALQSDQGIDVNQPLNVSGSGIFQTPGNVELNHVQAVFQKGINVKANAFNFNGSDVHVTGDSYVETNTVNLNAESANLSDEWPSICKRKKMGILLGKNTTPSNFHHHGNLHWKVKVTVIDGSNFHVKGNMLLDGGVVKVISRMYTYAYEVEVGKVKSKSLGGLKKKSKKLHETHWKTEIAALATFQVENKLFLENAEGVEVDGGVFLAGTIQGHANNVFVGIKSQFGESPTTLPPFHNALGLPARPGGDLQITGNCSLSTNNLHVNGFISAYGELNIDAVNALIEKRLVEGTTQVAKVRRSGRIKKHTVTEDHTQPGGCLHGATGLHLHTQNGVFKSAEISSGSTTLLTGNQAILLPAIERKAVHLKGKVSPFKSCSLYSMKREFVGTQLMGKEVLVDLKGPFISIASDIAALNQLFVRAASIRQEVRFDIHKSKVKRGLTESQDIRTVTVKEATARCFNGPVTFIATDSDIYIEGEVGSLTDHTTLQAARDISIITRSQSAHNRVSSTSVTFPKITHQSTGFNFVKVATAHIFGGNGLTIKAGRTLVTEGPSIEYKGDATIEAEYWDRREHQTSHYVNRKATSLGLKFFGSEAIAAAVNKESPSRIAEALINEDPLLNNFCNLVGGSKDGVEAAKKAVVTSITGWNEFSKFSKAFNEGKLGPALGQHLGLTNANGDFSPTTTLEIGHSKQATKWTENLPTTIQGAGNLTINVNKVRDRSAQIFVTGDVEGNIRELIEEPVANTFSQKGFKATFGISYGPTGWGVSGSYEESSGRKSSYIPGRLIANGNVTMNIGRWVKNGSQVEGENVKIKVDEIYGKSMCDTSKQKGFNLSGSGLINKDFSSFSVTRTSFGMSREESSKVEEVASIVAHHQGELIVKRGELQGVLLQNMKVNREAAIQFKDLKERKKGLSLGLQYFGKNPRNNPEDEEGIKLHGDLDFRLYSKKGKVRTTMMGGNGVDFPDVNTQIEKLRKKGSNRDLHLGTPLFTFDRDILETEAENIGQAFGLWKPLALSPPVVLEMPKKQPFAMKGEPKKEPEPKREAGDKRTLEAVIRGDRKDLMPKSEANPPKKPIRQQGNDPATESKNSNSAGAHFLAPLQVLTYLLGNTISSANAAMMLDPLSPYELTQSSETETAPILRRSFWKQITDPALQLAHLNAQSTLAKISLLPLTIEAFASSNAKRSFKQQITDLSLELLSLKVKSTMAQARLLALPIDGINYSIEKTIEDLNHACETSDSPVFRRSCQDVAKFRQSAMDLAQRLGVTDLFKTMYSAYTRFVDYSARENRYLNIDDDMSRTFYSDVIKIATAVIPLPHISKAIKPPPLKPRATALINNASEAKQLPVIALNQPPNIERFISKITGVIQEDTKNPSSLYQALINQREKILKYFPDFSYLGNDHQIWSAMMNQGMPFAPEPTIQYLRRGYPSDVVKVTSNQQTAIIKELDVPEEVLSEVFGLKALHGLELRYLQTPQLMSFGKCAPGRFAVAKTYLKGDTLGKLLEQMGSYPLGTRERQTLFSELNNASYKAGRAMGELQSKGLKYADNPSPHVDKVSFIAEELEENITFAQDILKDVKLSLKDPSPYLDSLVAKFEKDPGIASFSLRDIAADQFVWSKETSSFGHIDAAMIPSGLDLQGRPTFFSGYDYHEFRSIFDTEALSHGLTMQEANLLKNTFDGGFYTSFTGRITAGANEFFDFYSSVNTLDFLAEKLSEGKIEREIVKKFLNQTNRKIQKPESYIQSHFNPIIINKRTPLIPEHLGIPTEISGQRSFEYLKGWVTLNKKEKTLKVQVNELEERVSLNFKKAMSHLFELAKYNHADILHIEATFSNDKLERVLETFFGKPQIEMRRDWKWSIFKIPVPKSIEKLHFAVNKETANRKQTLMRFLKEDSGSVKLPDQALDWADTILKEVKANSKKQRLSDEEFKNFLANLEAYSEENWLSNQRLAKAIGLPGDFGSALGSRIANLKSGHNRPSRGLEIKSELPSPKKVKRRNKNCPERIQDPIIYEKIETGEQKKELVPLDKSQPPLLTHDLHYVQKIIDDGYAIIRKERDTKILNFAIDDFEREIAESFHDYTYLANTTENLQTREKIWTHLVDRGSPHSTKPKIEYLHTYADEKDCLVKVEVGHSSAIVKDMNDSLVLNELFGLHAMRSLELKHFTLPQPLAVGKYKTIFTTNKYINSERYFFIRAHVEGDPFDSLMHSVCQHPRNSEERNTAFTKLAKATLKLGKGVGELQSKGLKYKDSPSPQARTVNTLFRNIEELHVEEAQEALKNLKIPFKDPLPYLEFLAENFEKDRGFITYTLADVQLEHFIVSETGTSIGLVDFAQIPMDLDLMNKPRHFGARDFYEILSLFDSEGLSAGLTFGEAHMLKKAFKKGYFSQIENHFSKASQQFFDFGFTLRTLNDLAQDLYAGKITDRKLVKTFANRVNNKITQFNEDITPKRLPKPNQLHLLAYNPHPPAIQEFIHNAFELAKQAAPKESYAIHALIKAEEQISKIIPDVSHLGNSSEAIWLTMVHGEQKRALLFQIEYFELNPFFRDRGNVVARIECQGKSTIVKQKDFPYFIGEVGALDKLHSLQIENLQFPKIEAVGKNGEQYILAKTNLEGITFKDFLKGIGEKTSLLQQFCTPCHQFGKGMGELQSKGLKYRDSKLRSIDSLQLIDYHSASLENTQSLLKDLNLSPLELDHGYFTLVAIHFERNPGAHTISLVDLHSGNIIWNTKNSTVGFIDCESLLTRMDHLRNPVSFPGQDFYEFLLELDVQGMHLGLTLQETHILKQAFIKGYSAEFTGLIADTSDHLFGFSAEVRRLFLFAQALEKDIIKDKSIVENLIQSLNQKALSNEPGRRNIKQWMID